MTATKKSTAHVCTHCKAVNFTEVCGCKKSLKDAGRTGDDSKYLAEVWF